jgi:hypothetical protein
MIYAAIPAGAKPDLHPQVAAQALRRGRQPGRGRRPAVHLQPLATEPVAQRPHDPAIERLHEAFKRRINTRTVLLSADTAATLFWALLASGQINVRKVDCWQTLRRKPIDQPIDPAD